MTPEQLARLPAVLFEIGKAIGSDEDTGAMLSRISEQVCALVGAEACSVMLLDAARAQLLAKAAHGLRSERMHRLAFRVGEGVAGWVAKHCEPALIDDVTGDPRFVVLEDQRTQIRSMVCVPLVARGESSGVLTVTSVQPHAFTGHTVDLLRFIATTIALDVENLRLHRVSVTDGLTGAYNREFLQQRLPLELEVAQQRQLPLSLAMVDVDHFKAVNDRYGHDTGDTVLAEVARRLRGAIRADDLLVRYGGEEFLIVLPRSDASRACEVGDRMRTKMAHEAVVADGATVEVRISVGIAQHAVPVGTEPVESPAELIRRADSALYAAKARGRNRVEVAP
jgi:diguanylate cyclase (GGDEF)-like protein